jgi:hypothetical protein
MKRFVLLTVMILLLAPVTWAQEATDSTLFIETGVVSLIDRGNPDGGKPFYYWTAGPAFPVASIGSSGSVWVTILAEVGGSELTGGQVYGALFPWKPEVRKVRPFWVAGGDISKLDFKSPATYAALFSGLGLNYRFTQKYSTSLAVKVGKAFGTDRTTVQIGWLFGASL